MPRSVADDGVVSTRVGAALADRPEAGGEIGVLRHAARQRDTAISAEPAR